MEYEDKIRVVKRSIEMIPEHGSIRVSHVCGETELNFSEIKENISTNKCENNIAIYRSIAGLVLHEQGDKYTIVPILKSGEEIDYDVMLNTNYHLNESIKNTNRWIRITSITSIFIAAITGFFIAMQFFKDASPNLQSTNTQLELLVQRQDSMLLSQKGIDSSLREMAGIDSLRYAKSQSDAPAKK